MHADLNTKCLVCPCEHVHMVIDSNSNLFIYIVFALYSHSCLDCNTKYSSIIVCYSVQILMNVFRLLVIKLVLTLREALRAFVEKALLLTVMEELAQVCSVCMFAYLCS